MDEPMEMKREFNQLLESLDSSAETQGRGRGGGRVGIGGGGEVCIGGSAAAPSSLLTSLATRQCGVGGRVLGSNFNTISLIVDIKHPFLDLLIDLLGCVDESLLYIRGSLG